MIANFKNKIRFSEIRQFRFINGSLLSHKCPWEKQQNWLNTVDFALVVLMLF